MVQGLGFLSKKSWHTKNIANQEKVWVAEQRKAAEEAKTKELAKQIQQEREQEELEKLTGKKQSLDKGIDWMYQGQNAQSEIAKEDAAKEAEEYLLGKEYVPPGGIKGDLDDGKADEGVNAVVQSASQAAVSEQPTYNEPTVAERNEAFRLRTEDPMFAVSRQAYQKKQEYEKKKKLYERVTGGTAVEAEESEKRRKKHKKDKKKKKKRHRRSRDYSDSESDESRRQTKKSRRNRRDRSRSVSRSPSRSPSRSQSRHRDEYEDDRRRHRRHDEDEDRKRKSHHDYDNDDWKRKREHEEERYRRERDRDYDEGRRNRRYDDEDRMRRRHYDEHTGERRHRDHDGSPIRLGDGEPYHREDHRRDDRKRPSPRDHDYDDRKRAPREHDVREYHDDKLHQDREPSSDGKKAGYGLQGGTSSLSSSHPDDLGPNADLLRRKREEREAERRRLKEMSSSRRRMTAEERAEALKAMESDAKQRDGTRQRHSKCEDDDPDAEEDARGSASFLKEMTQQTHGIDGHMSLSERVAQNRNTNQRRHDSFL